MDAPKSTVPKASPEDRKLRVLEEKYRHELLDEEERCELRDRILRIKRGGRL